MSVDRVPPPTNLTTKDIDVLELSSQGLSTKQIATRSGETVQAVNSRITRAQAKLGAYDRTHAVAIALNSGLIRGPQPVEVTTGNPRTLAEFAAEYQLLKAAGLPRREIAQKLGVQRHSLDRMVYRARQANLMPPAQPRAVTSC